MGPGRANRLDWLVSALARSGERVGQGRGQLPVVGRGATEPVVAIEADTVPVSSRVPGCPRTRDATYEKVTTAANSWWFGRRSRGAQDVFLQMLKIHRADNWCSRPDGPFAFRRSPAHMDGR